MFEKLLEEKSSVQITEGRWNIHTDRSEYNQCGSLGRNDCIKRQDAVRLLGEMNIKLVKVYEKTKEANPKLAEELLQSTSVLSYAMWGIRELPSISQENTSTELVDVN